MKIFNIKSLLVGYGDTPVLKNINTTVNSGDFTGIIGPNGAGKSTFLKVLTGVLKPLEGVIEFIDKPLLSYDHLDLAKEMAVVPQFLANILPFSVENFVGMGRFPFQNFWEGDSKEDKRIVLEALETTGTAHLKDRLLTELSGGELQLVCIARALSQNKNVILLDEPISSLDLKHSIRIMDLLHNLNQEGATILTVLHNINIASDYCTGIIGLKNGDIYCDGKPGECITADLISSLFDRDCSVKKNPVTGKPYIYPHPDYVK